VITSADTGFTASGANIDIKNIAQSDKERVFFELTEDTLPRFGRAKFVPRIKLGFAFSTSIKP
tara:strand:- start:166 stop:354 length:189 start_codon:yes stop_codon:yes gene_type:complete